MMGLVSYSTDASGRRPGFRIGNRVVDLHSVNLPEPQDENWAVAELQDIADRVWESLSSDQGPEITRLGDVTFHQPISPGKIVRFEGCYEHDLTDTGFDRHLEDAEHNELEWPSLWVAPQSSTTDPGATVEIPSGLTDVRPGVELCLVVGERAKNRSGSEALEVIAGCTSAIGLAAHDELPGLQGYKMFAGFLPFGPQLVPIENVTPDNLDVGVGIEGETLDIRTTKRWRFDISELVSYASSVLTLEPGDLLLTGDPTRIDRPVKPGEDVTAWIEDVGTLTISTRGGDDA